MVLGKRDQYDCREVVISGFEDHSRVVVCTDKASQEVTIFLYAVGYPAGTTNWDKSFADWLKKEFGDLVKNQVTKLTVIGDFNVCKIKTEHEARNQALVKLMRSIGLEEIQDPNEPITCEFWGELFAIDRCFSSQSQATGLQVLTEIHRPGKMKDHFAIGVKSWKVAKSIADDVPDLLLANFDDHPAKRRKIEPDSSIGVSYAVTPELLNKLGAAMLWPSYSKLIQACKNLGHLADKETRAEVRGWCTSNLSRLRKFAGIHSQTAGVMGDSIDDWVALDTFFTKSGPTSSSTGQYAHLHALNLHSKFSFIHTLPKDNRPKMGDTVQFLESLKRFGLTARRLL